MSHHASANAIRKRAFSLLELLVVIAIISALLGLLVPTLARAREAGQDAVCLSNLRQIGVGWTTYTSQHRVFPWNTHANETMISWGGVDWYTVDAPNGSGVSISPTRPVNPYIGAGLRDKSRAEVFRCPRDTGCFEWGNPERRYYFLWESQWENRFNLYRETAQSAADDYGESIFAVLGTSYRANDWMWCKPGSITGIRLDTRSQTGNRTLRNRPDMVDRPSDFVLVGDYGPFLAGRIVETTREPVPFGWWHGKLVGSMVFLDGSARRPNMTHGTATGRGYTFYVAPELHKPWSWVFADSPIGSPRRPASPPGGSQ